MPRMMQTMATMLRHRPLWPPVAANTRLVNFPPRPVSMIPPMTMPAAAEALATVRMPSPVLRMTSYSSLMPMRRPGMSQLMTITDAVARRPTTVGFTRWMIRVTSSAMGMM